MFVDNACRNHINVKAYIMFLTVNIMICSIKKGECNNNTVTVSVIYLYIHRKKENMPVAKIIFERRVYPGLKRIFVKKLVISKVYLLVYIYLTLTKCIFTVRDKIKVSLLSITEWQLVFFISWHVIKNKNKNCKRR